MKKGIITSILILALGTAASAQSTQRSTKAPAKKTATKPATKAKDSKETVVLKDSAQHNAKLHLILPPITDSLVPKE
jgi:hypothetical protein